MFQAVLAGCILIKFFIYDPLLYFLKKLAGAKNLLDLHALGRVSNVRYMQECIKMKRSQSLQNGQAPPRVVPRLPAGSLGCLRAPTPASDLGSLLSLLASATDSGPLRGASADPCGRRWSWVLWWLRLDSGSAWGRGLQLMGVSRALLRFPGLPQWPLKQMSLSLFSFSLGSMLGVCFVLSVLVSHEGSLSC